MLGVALGGGGLLVGFGEGAADDAGPGYEDLRYYAVGLYILLARWAKWLGVEIGLTYHAAPAMLER